jgi:L-ectoine synthase
MLRRRLAEVNGTDRDVRDDWWRSRRLLVAEDGLPYSFHITIVHPGARLQFEYANHRETVYCIAGAGTLHDLASGETFAMERGSLYTAGIGAPHEVVADTEMTLVCVFDPPLEGTEEAD